jgi:hypothetical protein
MNQCSATKPNGERCTLPANGPQGVCWAHAPEHREKRRKNASKAAKAKGNKEVAIIKEEIKTAIAEVRNGDMDRNKARAMFTGWGVLLDYIRLERQVYLEEDLAVRIEELKRERGNAS